MKYSTIFFDLGSTLLYPRDPWAAIYTESNHALMAVLRANNLPVDTTPLSVELECFLDAYYIDRADGIYEKTTFTLLKEILAKCGHPHVPEPVLRAALEALYAITQQNWHLEDDAIATLQALRSTGIRLGLISNTSDDRHVHQLMERRGLQPFFECVVTSAGCGIRKPDGRIFQLALDAMHTQPAVSMMIGDTLEADILGANLIGIYSVWITRRSIPPTDGDLPIQPQAVISSLAGIPTLLADLDGGKK